MKNQLTAPFPYNGGKSRVAKYVWKNFGNVNTYIEPFAGSLAVLLANPNIPKREIVGDTDATICNFWRAVSADPEKVAKYAVYPTIHQDLAARHLYMVKWFAKNSYKFNKDPKYYNAKIAGWWCHGKSLWIGSEYCNYENSKVHDFIPQVQPQGCGKGINAQRSKFIKISDKIPFIHPGGSGSGTSSQRKTNSYENHLDNTIGWLGALADRLFKVIVLNRSWESCVTPTVLGSNSNIGIFLDPPYLISDRRRFYLNDNENADDAAINSYKWAIENGGNYKIAYCFGQGEFEIPKDWTYIKKRLMGVKKRDKYEMIMFSPRCKKEKGLLI